MTSPALTEPLAALVGGRAAGLLAQYDIHTVSDLLRYYPRRYSERGALTDLAHLPVGDYASVWARIVSVHTRVIPPGRTKRRRYLTTVMITDGVRSIPCTFFNQPWMEKRLDAGMEAMFSGKVTEYRGKTQMSGPEIATDDGNFGDLAEQLDILEKFASGLIPVYPLRGKLTQAMLGRCVKQVVEVVEEIADPLPEEVREREGFCSLDTALREIHRPSSKQALAAAQRRLRYDEALAVQLVLARRRATVRSYPAWPCPPIDDGLLASFDKRLPFVLTAGQQQVGADIARDVAAATPMNRLLQGDVGSGKTVVALRAMLQVVDAGRQTALLAPTEVLAAQHVRSLRQLLGPLGRGGELGAAPEAIAVTLLTGSSDTAARRRALLEIVSGQPGIVVGTHALLSDDVMFSNLGLIVVDEQHRFGVEQRDLLRAKAPEVSPPHMLVMTATPIPRTVAMTVYGDLDTSQLSDMPTGRAGVSTTVVPAAERPQWVARIWQRIREEVASGHQVYIVCPKIGDGSDTTVDSGAGVDSADGAVGQSAGAAILGGAGGMGGSRPPVSVRELAEYVAQGPLQGVRLAQLHGRMTGAGKDDIMQAFTAGDIDVLISTTVIEVGVDVANASMMVIVDAERFGISQLHQLRGRIGRGSVPGVCLLVTESTPDSPGGQRLTAVAATTDGFELAEADLTLRREGDVLGTSQAGRASSLQLLSLLTDQDVITTARRDATELVASDPQLNRWPGLVAMADAIVSDEGQEFITKT